MERVKIALTGTWLSRAIVFGLVLVCLACGSHHAGRPGPEAKDQGIGTPQGDNVERIPAGEVPSSGLSAKGAALEREAQLTPGSKAQSLDQTQPAQATQSPGPQVSVRSREPVQPQTEQARVEKAAKDLAAGERNVVKITICYVAKSGEWWVVVYEDLGHTVDVKRFTWNPESEKLERFLVMERVPHARVNDEEAVPVRGGTCTVLAVGPGAPPSVQGKAE